MLLGCLLDWLGYLWTLRGPSGTAQAWMAFRRDTDPGGTYSCGCIRLLRGRRLAGAQGPGWFGRARSRSARGHELLLRDCMPQLQSWRARNHGKKVEHTVQYDKCVQTFCLVNEARRLTRVRSASFSQSCWQPYLWSLWRTLVCSKYPGGCDRETRSGSRC